MTGTYTETLTGSQADRNKSGHHRQYLTWDVHCSAGLAPGSKPVTVGQLP
jgi:hypothetical protein